MANTIVEFASYDGRASSLQVYLVGVGGVSSGTPDGYYVPTEPDTGLYRIVVPEPLVGLFRVKVLDAGRLTLRQYVRLADTTLIYVAHESTDLSQIANQLSVATDGLEDVLKSGEEFMVTSVNDIPKYVTFTRQPTTSSP